MKNYGLNVQKELASHSSEDWLAGASSLKPLITVPIEDRRACLPDGEVQQGVEDTHDCASRAPHNILETDFIYGIKNNKFSKENTQWLFDKGFAFYKDGVLKFEVSDAFTAILSGTDIEGNSLKAPIDCIHNNGLIPKKMLPLISDMTFAQYIEATRVTQEMRDLGKELIARFPINYDKFESKELEKNIEERSVVVGAYAWTEPNANGEYPATDAPANHAFIIFALPKFFIFDNYIDPVDGDFIKKLAKNYVFIPYSYRIFISHEVFVDRLKKNWVSKLLAWFNSLFT